MQEQSANVKTTPKKDAPPLSSTFLGRPHKQLVTKVAALCQFRGSCVPTASLQGTGEEELGWSPAPKLLALQLLPRVGQVQLHSCRPVYTDQGSTINFCANAFLVFFYYIWRNYSIRNNLPSTVSLLSKVMLCILSCMKAVMIFLCEITSLLILFFSYAY